MFFIKNKAVTYKFFMMDTTNRPAGKTGLSPAVTIQKDDGSFSASTNSAVEIVNGWYKILLTSTELNADSVAIEGTAGGADNWREAIYPSTDIAAGLTRIQGLLGQNAVLDDTVYSGNKMTSGILYLYDSAANAATHDKSTGLIGKYTIAATITATNTTLITEVKDS